MAHLLFDIGNTRSKMAVMEKGTLLEVAATEQLRADAIERLTERYAIDAAAACVTGAIPDFGALLPSALQGRFHLLSHRSAFPFRIDYETPNTLGMDRLAAVAGARELAPQRPLMVVDAGTCITVDLLDDKDVYRGGAILPGLVMRFRALHEQTAALPLVVPTSDELRSLTLPPLCGRSTREAIMSGVLRAAAAEIQCFASEVAARYPAFKLFLTGGDADFFANQVKFPNFANSTLLFVGLEKLLNMNINC